MRTLGFWDGAQRTYPNAGAWDKKYHGRYYILLHVSRLGICFRFVQRISSSNNLALVYKDNASAEPFVQL
jgi:hypothetical protein